MVTRAKASGQSTGAPGARLRRGACRQRLAGTRIFRRFQESALP